MSRGDADVHTCKLVPTRLNTRNNGCTLDGIVMSFVWSGTHTYTRLFLHACYHTNTHSHMPVDFSPCHSVCEVVHSVFYQCVHFRNTSCSSTFTWVCILSDVLHTTVLICQKMFSFFVGQSGNTYWSIKVVEGENIPVMLLP